MKTKLLASAVLVAAGLGVASFVRAGNDEKTAPEATKVIHISSHDGEWKDLGKGGVKQIVLQGDPRTGENEVFTKFPAGTDNGWHSHTSTVKMVVLEGTYVFRDEHGKEIRVKAGDYLVVPGGMKHWSGSDEGCVFFDYQPGKFDLIPAKK